MLRKILLVLVVLVSLAVLVTTLAYNPHNGAAGFSGTRLSAHDYVVRTAFPPSGTDVILPPVKGPSDTSRPLIVIDAGHGGHDPGAHNGGRDEKQLTLALATALELRLLAGGGIRVAMTRSDDHYLLLKARSGIARRLKADLFVSIHADSSKNTAASGATVYTLSNRGSSEESERLAASENRADRVNGIPLGDTSNAVNGILVDLAQRHSEAQADQFAGLILREGSDLMSFRHQALQSASFVVLKSPDIPSVLIEAGYISDSRDVAWLASGAGQQAFAKTADRAIRVYFARQSNVARLTAP